MNSSLATRIKNWWQHYAKLLKLLFIASVIILSSYFSFSSNLTASSCHWSFSTINAIKYDESTNIKLSPFQSF